MPGIRIGDRHVGPAHPVYVIAEAGSNHNRDLQMARQLIDVAADAGADAVKFQVFRAARMYPRSAGVSDYLKVPTPIVDIIAAMEMPYEWLPVLSDHCRARSVHFLATPFDEESADRLDPYVETFKIASYEMTHAPLLRHVAAKGTSMILSTGTSNLAEVEEAVATCREAGNRELALLQCTAAYPAPIASINVRALVTLADRFQVPVGLSDHSRDPIVAPVAAVACGASIIEKHFTLSNALAGPDHRFALEPHELREMVTRIRQAELVRGSGEKVVDPVEDELRAFARRSVFATRAIAAGEVFSRDNIAVLRQGKNHPGLPPSAFPGVLGRYAKRAIASDAPVQQDDIS